MNNAQVLVGIMVVIAVAIGGAAGCSKVKQAKEAAEAVQIAKDAQDGDFTVKSQEEEIKVKTDKDDEKAGSITITGPDGTTTVKTGKDTVTEEEVGIKFYPGAKVQAGTTWSASNKESGSISSVTLETTDAFDKVAKFYKDRYAKGNTVLEQPDSLMIMINSGESSGKMIMVSREEGEDVTTIGISVSQDN
ncbi:MAG: hypothetical protein ACUVX8_03215 [Candidatus Zipacnadales bacterium]